ncbi:Crp/Fnr family transcriptional regulator [Bradyrhizobium sp. 186]|uniref:Crp/Fnr family transcriptional regulator n=1 Tax=Bradyrhizobium sp. 186 TaxID=2782654 RepID=UPI002059D8E4|nr:Crp/Fnr family transcriptional regulator [Bradyrhizobium sp. 186]
MAEAHAILESKLRQHSRLSNDDISAIRSLPYRTRELTANEDLIRQGDQPDVSALVLRGMLARYHLLPNGARQYISFHFAGDLPDAQALFLDQMDHSVCALGNATVASLPHRTLCRVFERQPKLAFAIWRETLIDAAIFREAITNNGSRDPATRMAHLFAEVFYRAEASRLTNDGTMDFPISLVQLGETLGMSIATVNRALAILRSSSSMEFNGGKLEVFDGRRLAEIGQFDPSYLHLRATQRLNKSLLQFIDTAGPRRDIEPTAKSDDHFRYCRVIRTGIDFAAGVLLFSS